MDKEAAVRRVNLDLAAWKRATSDDEDLQLLGCPPQKMRKEGEVAKFQRSQSDHIGTILKVCIEIMMKQHWMFSTASVKEALIVGATSTLGAFVMGRPGFVIGSLVGAAIGRGVCSGRGSSQVCPSVAVGALGAEERKKLAFRALAVLNKYKVPVTGAIAILSAVYANREALRALLGDLKEYFQKEKKMKVTRNRI